MDLISAGVAKSRDVIDLSRRTPCRSLAIHRPLSAIADGDWAIDTSDGRLDHICHINENPHISGEMSTVCDVQTGEVRTRASGYWSIAQARAFFRDWRRMVNGLHSGGQSVFALVDMSEGAAQSADVVKLIETATVDLYRTGDAIAMLVPSSIAKMQMRRVLDAHYHEFFISRVAAELWLTGRRVGLSAPTGAAWSERAAGTGACSG